MSLQLTIRESLKKAMKEKDQIALDTLRAALAAFTNEAISLGTSPQQELSDEQVLIVIRRLVKQRKDAIEQYVAGGREDLAVLEQAQVAVLEQYLPAPMNEEAIRVIVQRKRDELALTDKSKIGILVGAVMKEVGARSDGATVKKIVETLWE